MIIQQMKVTVENQDGGNELKKYVGKNATVIRVTGCWAIIDIADVGQRGCLVEYLQPHASEWFAALAGDMLYGKPQISG